MNAQGKVTISLDFECGWGYVSDGSWYDRQSKGVYKNLRPALNRFVTRLDELEFETSWAVVGAMIDVPRQRDFSHLKGSYAKAIQRFASDAEEMTHDGRDLLDMVTSMRTRQRFGTHTYSHIVFSDSEQNPCVFAEDLSRAVKVNTSLGLEADRLVFPQNHYGHLDTVRAAGITHARMPAFNAVDPRNRPGRLARAVSTISRPVSPIVEKLDESGLVLHYASEFLNWGAQSGFSKRGLHRRRINRAITQASNGSDVHFWLHPFNLVETPGLDVFLDNLLVRIARLRDRDAIQVGGF